MSFCANFEGCAAKTLGVVGFLLKAYFSLPQSCQFLAHGCRNRGINLKLKMGDRINTIFMFHKFGDDPISSLDFSFIKYIYFEFTATNRVSGKNLWGPKYLGPNLIKMTIFSMFCAFICITFFIEENFCLLKFKSHRAAYFQFLNFPETIFRRINTKKTY